MGYRTFTKKIFEAVKFTRPPLNLVTSRDSPLLSHLFLVSPEIMDAIIGNDSIKYIWIYLVGPLAGGALAALAYKFLNDD